MKLTTVLNTVALVSLGSLGCDSSGPDAAGLALIAVTVDQPAGAAELAVTDDADTEFTLTTASLEVRDIELDLPEGTLCADVEADLVGATCSDETIKIDGPFTIDLVAATSEPTLDDIELPALSYRRLDVRVDDNSDDVSFAALADFELDGAPVVLDLSLGFNEDIRVEGGDGVAVDADTDLVVEFVASDWLSGIDIAGCIEDGDLTVDAGTVSVSDDSSSGSCSDIENTIKDNMKNSGRLDRD